MLHGICHSQSFQFFHRLSPNEGLSQGTNAFVFQDSRGFVWLSSIDGLNRFDGKSVKIYKADGQNGLSGNIITSNFFEDSSANLWFTTHEGIHCYVREKDRFEYFQLHDAQGKKIEQEYFVFYLDKQQQLWVQASGYLHLFDLRMRQGKQICPLSGRRQYVVCDTPGVVSKVVSANIPPTQSGILVLDMRNKGQVTTFFTDPVQGQPVGRSFSVYCESPDCWWVAMTTGLTAFYPQSGRAVCYDRYGNQPIGEVWALAPLRDSMLMVSTSLKGFLLFDKKQQRFIRQIPATPDRKPGLGLRNISAFYVDKQENLWISSPRNGVNFTQLHKQKFEKKEALQGVSMTSIFQTKDGAVWCNGPADTVFRFSPDGLHSERFALKYPQSEALPGRIEYFFEDNRGDLWACHQRFIFRWNPSKRVFKYTGLLPGYVLGTRQLTGGPLLLSTYGGIYSVRRDDKGPIFEKADFLGQYQSEAATALFEDQKKRLYLALDATRIAVLEKKQANYEPVRAIENIGCAHAFCEQGNTLWVATTTGILKINTADLSFEKLNAAEHGAPSENYYSILTDRQGHFWLSCNRGIIRYHPETKTFHRYTLADGLQDNEFNTNAFLLQSNGRIWMGGNQGMNVFDPDQIQALSKLPQVQLTRLLVNDELFETPVQVGELRELTLAYQQNTFSFDFVALEYSDPGANIFRYQLENYDKDWVDAGTNGFARYANLPPGNYTFKVKAANSDGVWNETPTALRIRVLTPWWQSWWFYLLCVSVTGGLIYGWFWFRLQQALRLERLRVKISSDLHDDVGTLLAGLAMQSEALAITAPEKDKGKLQRISEISRNAMAHMRDTVWAIDARKDKWENLLDRMREHAEETLVPRDMRFELTVENIAAQNNIPVELRQNLYLIYKEAITNAARHSNGNTVRVHLKKTPNGGLEMRICDNGTSAEKNYKTTGSGTSNMQMRAKKIGGTLEISREAEEYCVVLRK
jgi:ligand-binding sensor domain-containing protein/two-component sensor histidine kinase